MLEVESSFFIVADEHIRENNKDIMSMLPEALSINSFSITKNVEESDCILVIGGDGSLLRAIQAFKKLNKPFLGLHGGSLGYYMNHVELNIDEDIEQKALNNFFDENFNKIEFPMIKFHAYQGEERLTRDVFNDVWVERTEAQALKMNVAINGEDKGVLIIGDGMLFSTPTGTTAYAKNLGGLIFPYNLKAYQMVPKACSVDKQTLMPLPLNMEDKVEITFVDNDFRTLRLTYDGIVVKDLVPDRLVIEESEENVTLLYSAQNDFTKRAFSWHFS